MTATITLTGKQVVLLGWDDKSPSNPTPIRTSARGWIFSIEEGSTEAAMARSLAQEFAFGGGCDPSAIASAKGLLKKLQKAGL